MIKISDRNAISIANALDDILTLTDNISDTMNDMLNKENNENINNALTGIKILNNMIKDGTAIIQVSTEVKSVSLYRKAMRFIFKYKGKLDFMAVASKYKS